jgi:hypothetical protein
VSWPVQDLSFNAIFFCHRDPVSVEAGFPPRAFKDKEEVFPDPDTTNGTESLLIHQDVVEALALGSRQSGQLCRTASELQAGLEAIRISNGQLGLEGGGVPMFRKGGRGDGQRQGGSGEFVVHLRPKFNGSQALPEAEIDVWQREPEGRNAWKLARHLKARYEEKER